MNAWLRARRVSPALVLSGIALFFAIGGSAFAVGQHANAGKCANGAVKGYAVVTGDPKQGIQNLPDTYTSSPAVFTARYNCSGQGIQVKRLGGAGGYQIRFAGVASKTAVASVVSNGPGGASVFPMADGSFQVITAGNQPAAPQGTNGEFNRRADLGWVITVY